MEDRLKRQLHMDLPGDGEIPGTATRCQEARGVLEWRLPVFRRGGQRRPDRVSSNPVFNL